MNTPEQVTLTEISVKDKDANGNPLIGKNGKPYTKQSIRTAEYGNTLFGGFPSETSKYWKTGDKVLVILSKNGQYDNFRAATKTDLLEARIVELEKRVDKLEHPTMTTSTPPGIISSGGSGGSNITPPNPQPYPYESSDGVMINGAVINKDDIPF